MQASTYSRTCTDKHRGSNKSFVRRHTMMIFNIEKLSGIEDNHFTRLSLDDKGFIDYRVIPTNNAIVWDCYTDPKYRKQGVFKTLLFELRERYPFATFFSAVSNKTIIPYLEDIGYERITNPIPHWGRPNNCINMKQNGKA
jgi:GNAT superfamily N-acetyltransferase